MPLVHIDVGFRREGLAGQVGRERRPIVGVLQVPVAHGILEKGDMFLGSQKQFNALPADESLQRQGRDGGRVEVIVARLQGVLAPRNLPDVGYGLMWNVDKEC